MIADIRLRALAWTLTELNTITDVIGRPSSLNDIAGTLLLEIAVRLRRSVCRVDLFDRLEAQLPFDAGHGPRA
ncbi:hypothetical protein BTE28158_04636 [Burkholderia territorii]|nr:hypothetical protein BTE28158_04636 [Burkholderia territorii]